MIYAAVLLAPLASAAVVLLLLFAIVVGVLATAYVALQEAGGLRIPM